MRNEPLEYEEGLPAGQLLKRRRTALRLSLVEVERATRIRGKYLTKLEAEDYDALPNDIYTSGFVRAYADFLGLDGKLVAKQYLKERGGLVKADQRAGRAPVKSRRLIVTPKIFTILGILLVLAGVVAYLGWQFSVLAAAPKLTVSQPAADQVIYGALADVAGHVTPGADVTINDSPVLIDGDGNFQDRLSLQDGINSLRIMAKNKLGKTTIVNRSILAHLPKLNPADTAVPAAVFDGVAVSISIKDAATALTVTVDGQEAFKGTMLAGTTQLFKGTGRIVITTGNAGATSLTITNTVVAGKVISPLGGSGEVKRDLIFAKDTVVQ